MSRLPKKIVANSSYIILSLFVLAFLSNFIDMYVGITITPCMIMGAIVTIYNIKKHNFFKCTVDKRIFAPLMLFLSSIFIGIFFAYNPFSTGKILIKILVLLFLFWQFCNFYISLDRQKAVKTIEVTVLFYAIISLMSYVIGLFLLDFNFNIENTRIAGILIDRATPRLISLASNDPNISSVYFSIVIAFLMSQTRTKLNKIDLTLYLLLDILTFSRGGLVALAILLIIHLFIYIIKGRRFKTLLALIFVFIIAGCGIALFGSDIDETPHTIFSTIVDRFSESVSDGGSGRLIIWEKAVRTFNDHPAIGIGANNTLAYNTEHYGVPKYTHNSYLEILSETGIVGTIAFVILAIQLFRKGVAVFKKDRFPLYMLILVFISCFFLSLVYTEIFVFTIAPLVFVKKEPHDDKK